MDSPTGLPPGGPRPWPQWLQVDLEKVGPHRLGRRFHVLGRRPFLPVHRRGVRGRQEVDEVVDMSRQREAGHRRRRPPRHSADRRPLRSRQHAAQQRQRGRTHRRNPRSCGPRNRKEFSMHRSLQLARIAFVVIVLLHWPAGCRPPMFTARYESPNQALRQKRTTSSSATREFGWRTGEIAGNIDLNGHRSSSKPAAAIARFSAARSRAKDRSSGAAAACRK